MRCKTCGEDCRSEYCVECDPAQEKLFKYLNKKLNNEVKENEEN